MNETWLEACRSGDRVECLRKHFDGRQLILFATACCRLVWSLLSEFSRRAVEAAEGHADGLVTTKELWLKHKTAAKAVEILCTLADEKSKTTDAIHAYPYVLSLEAAYAVAYASLAVGDITKPTFHEYYATNASRASEAAADIYKDQLRGWQEQNVIFNSFLPRLVNQTWKNRTTVSLATVVYQGKHEAFRDLLDALEEAGAVLSSYRDVTFYKGNWLVDWLRRDENFKMQREVCKPPASDWNEVASWLIRKGVRFSADS